MDTRKNAATVPQAQGGYLPMLRRAALDDHFRAELEANPQAALARCGISIDPSIIPQHIALPEKGLLKRAVSAAEDESDIFDPVVIEMHIGFLRFDSVN